MKVTKLYNRVPANLLEKTKLKKGEKAVYKLANLQKDPMNPERWAVPVSVRVKPTDDIYDSETNEYYSIAAVKSVSAQDEHSFYDIFFTKGNAGILELEGGRATDQEIHSFLFLSDYRANKEGRDATKEALYVLVDEKKKADEDRRVRNQMRDAMNAAAEMKPQEVRDFTAVLGRDDKRDLSILRDEVESYAQNHPKEFLETYNNKQNPMKATLKRALDKGVILFSSEENKFTFPDGEVICVVARATDNKHLDGLIAHCVSGKKGEAIYQRIADLVK